MDRMFTRAESRVGAHTTHAVRRKMFTRLVLSYAALLLIPGGLLVYVVNFSVLDTIREQAVLENEKFLERGMRQAEQLFFELERIGVNIAQNKLLSRFALHESPQNRLRAVNQLRNYRFVTGELYDILYFPIGGNVLYSSYGLGDAESLLAHHYGFSNGSIVSSNEKLGDVRGRFLESEQTVTLGSGQEVSLLPYVWPLYEDAPHAIVVFLINAAEVRRLLVDGTPNHTSRIEVTNAQGDLLASWEDQSDLLDESLSTGAVRTAQIGPTPGGRELVHRVHSPSMRLTLSSTVHEEALMSQVREIERHLMLTMGVIFVAGSLIILMGLHSNYRPIAHLVRNVCTAFGIDPEGMDEVSLVRSALTRTADSNRRLQTRIESLKPLLRDYVLRELVESSRPLDDPGQVALVLGPEDGYVSVHAIVVVTHTEGDPSEITAGEPTVSISRIPNEADDVVILLVSESSNDEARLRRVIEGMKGRFTAGGTAEEQTPCAVGVGSVFTDILAAGRSYAQAMESLSGHSTWIPNAAADRLRRHLENGDLAAVRTTLSRMNDDLSESGSPQFLSRCMLYDLFNTVLRVASQHHVDLETVLGPDTYLFLTRTHQTIETLFDALDRACANLALHVRADSPGSSRMITDALRVIDDRCTDISFGAETLADELGVSVPHLSRSFKKAHGRTISEHIWQLRLARSKTLLKDSHAPIEEIAGAVGYTDTSAFIRRFRKETGVSPGKYRAQL